MRPSTSLVCLALLASCGGPATRIEPASSTASGIAGETIRVDFTLLDENDRALGGEDVTFELDGATEGTSLRDMVATTLSRGEVTAVVNLGAEGTFDLVATSGDATPGIVTVTVGGRPEPYIDCTGDEMCAPSERCITVTSATTAGRMCTRECTTDADCPTRTEEGAACRTAGSRPVCLARCAGPLDCVVGNTCVMYDAREGPVQVCLPVN